MNVKNSIPANLVSIVFVSIAIVFVAKYYDSQSKNKKLEETIQLDKKIYTNDLKEIFNRYDSAVIKNKEVLALKTFATKTEITNTKESSKNNQSIITTNVKNNYSTIDSLKKALKSEQNNTRTLHSQIADLATKNKELQKQNATNENTLSVSKNLTATNVYANGIKIVSNNIIETRRFSSTEQIKVCFTLLENKAALKGNKDIYIQIVNPNNKVVSKIGESYTSGDKLLDFSAKTNIFYDNEELDVCVFVDPNKEDMSKGDYEINIFSGINLIGNTVFSLK
ncbi:MAG: hypothetical protein RL494_911 [Bacteroidota bacterium]